MKSSAISRTRSGVPRVQPSANLPVGGSVLRASPFGAPASAQASSTATSAAVSDWSCLSFGPTPGSGFHGGIDRSPATAAMSLGPLAGLLVGLQRERPDLVAAMAVLALPLEDRQDILGVGRRARFPRLAPWPPGPVPRHSRRGPPASVAPSGQKFGPGRTVRISSGMRSQEVGAGAEDPRRTPGIPGDRRKTRRPLAGSRGCRSVSGLEIRMFEGRERREGVK